MDTLIYCRTSDKNPINSKKSIATQEEICLAEAKKLGCSNITIIKDEGESATNLDRPGMKKIMELCENKKADQIITIGYGRLSKNIKDHIFLREFFKQHNVKVHCVSQPDACDFIDDTIKAITEYQKSQIITLMNQKYEILFADEKS